MNKKEDLQRSRGVAENSSLAETTRSSVGTVAERINDVKFGEEPTETWNSRMEQTIRERLAGKGNDGDRGRFSGPESDQERGRSTYKGTSKAAKVKPSRDLTDTDLYETNRWLQKIISEQGK